MNVYEVVTERILTALKAGVVPWRQPWVGGEAPKNLVSGKPYRGVNVLLLSASMYDTPYWLTYKQCAERGGQVRKGEKATPVIFWKVGDRKEISPKTGRPEKSFILRYYNVFNVAQCDGIDYPASTMSADFSPIPACEAIVAGWEGKPVIDHKGSRACYSPQIDWIYMPCRDRFVQEEDYYVTLFHELTHSTGASHRLNRKGVTDVASFGSHSYSFEELVAECGASFLAGKAGILHRTLDNSVAYISNWIQRLHSEPRWIVEASSQAAKAADLILGVKNQPAETEDE